MESSARIVIVGGGLGGLATAALMARTGALVTVVEQGRSLGGRARSELVGEAMLNLGPHALYRAGRGVEVLRQLGVVVEGSVPQPRSLALEGGRLGGLPTGFASMLSTRLLGTVEKAELALLFARIPKLDTGALAAVTVGQWLRDSIRSERVARLVLALARLTTYSASPEQQSAAVVLRQIALAARGGVLYLDGGWQTLVAKLRAICDESGVEFRTGASATTLVLEGPAVRAVKLRGGTRLEARHVVLAAGTETALALVPSSVSPSLSRAVSRCVPARVASLDLVLSGLPRSDRRFVVGVDRPLYFSVHSDAARLAPEGTVVLHVARYLGADRTVDPSAVRVELEGFVDLVQPGWRRSLLEARFRPSLLATSDVGTAEAGGLACPETGVEELANLDVVGDWVGSRGLLADASLDSAAAAADRIAAAFGGSVGRRAA